MYCFSARRTTLPLSPLPLSPLPLSPFPLSPDPTWGPMHNRLNGAYMHGALYDDVQLPAQRYHATSSAWAGLSRSEEGSRRAALRYVRAPTRVIHMHPIHSVCLCTFFFELLDLLPHLRAPASAAIIVASGASPAGAPPAQANARGGKPGCAARRTLSAQTQRPTSARKHARTHARDNHKHGIAGPTYTADAPPMQTHARTHARTHAHRHARAYRLQPPAKDRCRQSSQACVAQLLPRNVEVVHPPRCAPNEQRERVPH